MSGHDIGFTKKGALMTKMFDCIESMITDFLGKFTANVKTPAAAHLLKVDPDCKKLEEK